MTKTQIKKILDHNNLAPSKKFGQNFLIDQNIINKIVSLFDEKDNIIEIGPGLGSISFGLAERVSNIVAVEIDKGFSSFLNDKIIKNNIDNLKIINKDFLKTNFNSLLDNKRKTIVGNLPYSVTGPLLIKLLENRKFINKAVIMVQKEVGNRLLSCPGSKEYGKISVYYQMFADLTLVHNVSKTCFFPVPKVESVILEIIFHKTPKENLKNEQAFFALIKHVFSQRRKTIKNSLNKFEYNGKIFSKIEFNDILKQYKMDEKLRAEDLSYKDYANIINNCSCS